MPSPIKKQIKKMCFGTVKCKVNVLPASITRMLVEFVALMHTVLFSAAAAFFVAFSLWSKLGEDVVDSPALPAAFVVVAGSVVSGPEEDGNAVVVVEALVVTGNVVSGVEEKGDAVVAGEGLLVTGSVVSGVEEGDDAVVVVEGTLVVRTVVLGATVDGTRGGVHGERGSEVVVCLTTGEAVVKLTGPTKGNRKHGIAQFQPIVALRIFLFYLV